MNMIYEGSTKNIMSHNDVTSFYFKDDYSVFDWGKMPDLINEKGFYLCQIGGFLFEYLESRNIKTHMKSYFNQTMAIEYFEPDMFIDLEVIFRFGVPVGSSLIKRGYREGEMFYEPLVEFSTKREKIDRLLNDDEAGQIANLDTQQIIKLKQKTTEIANILKEFFESKNVTLWDGKFEFAMNNDEFILTDSIGLDELRLSSEDQFFSKELLRQYYKNSAFYKEINEHKSLYNEIKKSEIINPPSALPNNIKNHVSKMYESFYRLICQDKSDLLKTWLQANKLVKYNQKVIVYGEGGREHAIANKIAQSPLVDEVFVHTKRKNIFSQHKDIYFNERSEFIQFCQEQNIDLVIIGPEAPLCEGITNVLRENKISVIGPNQVCSQLESSKIFTKNFLNQSGINSAESFAFDNYLSAQKFIKQSVWDNFVIKVDGLAAGKGVAVCKSQEEALKELDQFHHQFPNTRYLIEEKLLGREVSLFYIIDSNEVKFIGDACDYKTLLDGNNGPNTGGMGTYSPCDWIDEHQMDNIQKELSHKIKEGLTNMSLDYNGILFVGLMVNEQTYNVLEFNIRLGDPETQVLLPRINEDLYLLFKQCACNKLDKSPIGFHKKAYVHVVCSSENYPYGPSEKRPISFKPLDNDAQLILAGVEKDGEKFMASGGRVCGITASGMNKDGARKLAYQNINNINFEGKYFRNDIAN